MVFVLVTGHDRGGSFGRLGSHDGSHVGFVSVIRRIYHRAKSLGMLACAGIPCSPCQHNRHED